MPSPSPQPAGAIATSLNGFFRRGRITHIHFAENARVPPPALAYLVHFPRLALTLTGIDSLWIERNGQNRTLDLSPGEVLVVPANCWSRPLWTQPVTTLNVLFGRRQIGISLVSYTGQKPVPPLATKAAIQDALAEAPQSMMTALLALGPNNEAAARPLIDALLRAVVVALETPAGEPRRRAHSLHHEICMYVQENLQIDLGRDTVARHFQISPNHISRLFKREGQVSFNDYVNYARINRAKYLLKNHRQSLGEIAAACGFSDASYFCRVFKKLTRTTPTQYRQNSLPR
jgi:AraC-like DNA-binding protein